MSRPGLLGSSVTRPLCFFCGLSSLLSVGCVCTAGGSWSEAGQMDEKGTFQMHDKKYIDAHCLVIFYLFLFIFNFLLHWVFVVALAFSSCSKQGPLFVVVRGLLIVVTSLVAEHGL